MMIGEDLQRMYYARMTGNPSIMALANGVFDRVGERPYGSKTAYVSLGPEDYRDNGAECIDGLAITTQIDVWSKAVGALECKTLVELIRREFHEQEHSLAEATMVETIVEFAQTLPDPDKSITHGIVQVTAYVEI